MYPKAMSTLSASLLDGLSAARDERGILRCAAELLRNWSGATCAAAFSLTKSSRASQSSWAGDRPSALSESLVNQFLERVRSRDSEIAGELPSGTGIVQLVPGHYEGRCICALLAYWTSGIRQQKPDLPLILLGTLVAERLGQAKFRNDYTSIDAARQQELQLDTELERVLDQVVEELSFEYGAIWLADRNRNEIRVIRFRNLWGRGRSKDRYSLDDDATAVEVYRSGQYNPASQPEAGCTWVPLYWHAEVIGVLEAGGVQGDDGARTTSERIGALAQLAQNGTRIGEYRPEKPAMDVMAEFVRNDTGADSVTISAWRGEDCLIDGWDGDGPFDAAGALRLESDCLARLRTRVPAPETWFWDSPNLGGPACATLPFVLDDGTTILVTARWESRPAEIAVHHEELLVARVRMLVLGEILRSTIRQTAEHAYHLVALQSVAFTSVDQPSAGAILTSIAERAAALLGADLVCIYEYFREEKFGRLTAEHGQFGAPEKLDRDRFPMDVVQRHLANVQSRFVERLDGLADLLLTRRPEDTERFVVREGVQSCAMLKLTGPGARDMVGVMFLNYRKARAFPAGFQKEAEALALAAGTTISLRRFRESNIGRLERIRKETEALDRLDSFIVQHIGRQGDESIRSLCERALGELVAFLKATAGNIVRHDQDANALDFLVCFGFPTPPSSQPTNTGVAGRAIKTEIYCLVSDTREDEDYIGPAGFQGELRSELIVPIVQPNGVWGLINLEHSSRGHFRVEDLRLVELFARRLAFAVRLYEELSNQITQRITFGVIATRIQDPQQSLFRKLRLLLTGVTANEGLGFSRAMLLLLDEDGRYLRGKLAIGSLEETEARKVWGRLRNRERAPAFQRLTDLLKQTDADSVEIESGKQSDSALSRKIGSLSSPAGELQGVLKECISSTEARTYSTGDAAADWLGHRLEEPQSATNLWRFWAVPIMTGDKPIGALVVDNRFLGHREREDPPTETLRTLEAYADLAALVVDNTRLRERLRAETYEKLDHEIKGPILLAQRFLQQSLEGSGSSPLERAVAQLQRAYWAASNVKLFSDLSLGRAQSGDPRQAGALDLRKRIHAVVTTWKLLLGPERGISFEETIDYHGDLTLLADGNLLEQSLHALLQNAEQHSKGTIETTLSIDDRSLRFSVRNSSSISTGEFERIKSWRARGAESKGTGLGLKIAMEAMNLLGGKLSTSYVPGIFEVVAELPTKTR